MATLKVKDLIPDKRNANKHSEFGMQQLEKGLRQNGLGRSILISSDNEIIAGNGVTETAGSIGIDDVQIVDSDGSKIIAVRRTDIKSGTKEFYQMALSDNIIAKDNIVMDAEVQDAICEDYEIEDWNNKDYMQIPEGEDLIGEDKNKPPVMKITFKTPEQLQSAENDITELLDRKYKGAFYSVSAGDI